MNPTPKARNDDPIKPAEQLLRVETDYFVAGAVWKKIAGAWSCTQAAPIIRWMKGRTPEQVKLALLNKGAYYQWL